MGGHFIVSVKDLWVYDEKGKIEIKTSEEEFNDDFRAVKSALFSNTGVEWCCSGSQEYCTLSILTSDELERVAKIIMMIADSEPFYASIFSSHESKK